MFQIQQGPKYCQLLSCRLLRSWWSVQLYVHEIHEIIWSSSFVFYLVSEPSACWYSFLHFTEWPVYVCLIIIDVWLFQFIPTFSNPLFYLSLLKISLSSLACLYLVPAFHFYTLHLFLYRIPSGLIWINYSNNPLLFVVFLPSYLLRYHFWALSFSIILTFQYLTFLFSFKPLFRFSVLLRTVLHEHN